MSISSSIAGKLASYWKFDESSGNASDSVGSSTLTNNGTVTYASAKINNGAVLSSGKYFSCTDNADVSTTGDTTWSIWWYPTSLSNTNPYGTTGMFPFFDKWSYSTSSREYEVYFRNNSGTLSMEINMSTDGTSYAGAQKTVTGVSVNNWYHLVYIYKASIGSVEFFINGVSQGSVSSGNTSILNGTSTFGIGRFINDAAASIEGTIDEAAIWKRALDASEVKALYNSGSGVQYNFSTLPSNIPYIGNSLIDHDQGSGTVSYYNNGDLLVVSVNSTSNDVSAMTYNGSAMTQLGTAQYFSTYGRYHSTWYLVNPSVGTYNIVTTGGANWQFDIFSAYNVDQTTPISGATTTNTSGANAYVDVTTTVNNAYAIGVGQIAATSTAGTDTTMLVNGTAGNFYTLRSTSPVATAGTFRVQSAHAGSVGYFLRGFGINPVATITTNSGFFALM